jgi:hypothetical protein
MSTAEQVMAEDEAPVEMTPPEAAHERQEQPPAADLAPEAQEAAEAPQEPLGEPQEPEGGDPEDPGEDPPLAAEALDWSVVGEHIDSTTWQLLQAHPEIVEDLEAFAETHGLGNEAMSQLMTLQRSAIQAQQMALIQQLKSQQTELRQYVQDTWGSKADENMKLVAKGLDFLGLRQYVEQNPLCETPAFAEALLQAGRLMSEDELLSAGPAAAASRPSSTPTAGIDHEQAHRRAGPGHRDVSPRRATVGTKERGRAPPRPRFRGTAAPGARRSRPGRRGRIRAHVREQ